MIIKTIIIKDSFPNTYLRASPVAFHSLSSPNFVSPPRYAAGHCVCHCVCLQVSQWISCLAGMLARQPMCLPTCLSICLSVPVYLGSPYWYVARRCFCLQISQPVCCPASMSVRLYTCLSVCLSVRPFIFLSSSSLAPMSLPSLPRICLQGPHACTV